jgi:AbrB family looped-hinge helix DNA binding protein
VRITSKGQVTIPQEIRNKLGLLPNTEVEFVIEGDSARILKVAAGSKPTRGRAAVERLRGRAKAVSMSTDEILALTRSET